MCCVRNRTCGCASRPVVLDSRTGLSFGVHGTPSVSQNGFTAHGTRLAILARMAAVRTPFGIESSSFEAAGGHEGLSQLVDAFYRNMDLLPEAATIRAMHELDLHLSREKLKVFLAGWLGGPNAYRETFGPIAIPRAHEHLQIDERERDAWLGCMAQAVSDQPWSAEFKAYFMHAIAVPAERVRLASLARRGAATRPR
jgi:hemoglobin